MKLGLLALFALLPSLASADLVQYRIVHSEFATNWMDEMNGKIWTPVSESAALDTNTLLLTITGDYLPPVPDASAPEWLNEPLAVVIRAELNPLFFAQPDRYNGFGVVPFLNGRRAGYAWFSEVNVLPDTLQLDFASWVMEGEIGSIGTAVLGNYTLAPVPEPAALILLALGLPFFRRRA